MSDSAHRLLTQALESRRSGDLAPIRFESEDFEAVKVRGADLVGAKLKGSNWNDASLGGARLARADLEGAELRRADLAAVDLTDANLRNADLRGACVDDAILASADLRGACLAELLGDPLSLAGARIDALCIERSGFSAQEVNRLVARGVLVHQEESVHPDPRSVPPPSSFPSLALSLRPIEIKSRQDLADQDEYQMPPSMRAFRELTALIDDARLAGRAPTSLRPQVSRAKLDELTQFRPPEVGEEFLGVRLEKRLTGGTNSISYVGESANGAAVVVRIFDPNCSGAALQLPAFQRGVRALNRLAGVEPPLSIGSPSVVERDLSAVVVPYFDGGSLPDLLTVNPSIEMRLDVFRDLAAIYARLHDEGLLVRSIKPSNVLIDGLRPVLYEIDMVDLPTLSQYFGDLEGYGSYVAPEEILGVGSRSPTADIYGLGKLLEYLLTGKEPFGLVGGGSVLAERENIPRVLRDIVVRATERDPVDRYQYVSELLSDLDLYQGGEDVPLQPSIRPAELSRLSAKPLPLLPFKPVPISEAPPEPEKKPSRGDERWISRGLEISLASIGLLTAISLGLLLYSMPASIDRLERFVLFGAILVGFVAWFLPRPETRIGLKRLVAWATFAALVLVADPLHVASLRYGRDLKSGSSLRKAVAVTHLARLGKRNFLRAELAGVDLHGAELGSSNFQGAALENTNFEGAFLMEAVFGGARLAGANFVAADLRRAELGGAEGLDLALCDRRTRLPEGYRCRHGSIRASTNRP